MDIIGTYRGVVVARSDGGSDMWDVVKDVAKRITRGGLETDKRTKREVDKAVERSSIGDLPAKRDKSVKVGPLE